MLQRAERHFLLSEKKLKTFVASMALSGTKSSRLGSLSFPLSQKALSGTVVHGHPNSCPTPQWKSNSHQDIENEVIISPHSVFIGPDCLEHSAGE